jgi:surface protein
MLPKRPAGNPASSRARKKLKIRNMVMKVPNSKRGSVGYTIIAKPGARIGDTGIVDNVRYVIRSKSQLINLINEQNWKEVERTCTTKIRNMSGLFHGRSTCNARIGAWDTSNVTNMDLMFNEATAFHQKIGGWDTRNVATMMSMFRGAKAFNRDIRDWDVSSVRNMAWMFKGAAAFDQDIRHWNVRSVASIYAMFEFPRGFTHDVSHWITKLPTELQRDRFVTMAIDCDLTETVKHLNFPTVFRERNGSTTPPQTIRVAQVQSVTMLKLIRKTYPSFRLIDDWYYGTLHMTLEAPIHSSQRNRIVRLLDFLHREEVDLQIPRNARYNKDWGRHLKMAYNRPRNGQRATAIKSLDLAAGRSGLHLPKEIMGKIMYDARLSSVPYTHYRGSRDQRHQ